MAETPRQRLVRIKSYVWTESQNLTKQGAQSLGMIQTYSDQTAAREFTDRWNAILRAIEVVGSAVGKALAKTDTPDPVLTALGDEYTKLGNAIRDFNRSSWWKAPSKARVLIEAPFKTVAYVVVRVAAIVESGGESLLRGITFGMKNLTTLLVVGGFLYFGVPWLLKMRKAAKS